MLLSYADELSKKYFVCVTRRLPGWCQVDPTLTRADRLVGQVLGEVGALPDVFTELEINFFLLRRLLGVRTQVSHSSPALTAGMHSDNEIFNASCLQCLQGLWSIACWTLSCQPMHARHPRL